MWTTVYNEKSISSLLDALSSIEYPSILTEGGALAPLVVLAARRAALDPFLNQAQVFLL